MADTRTANCWYCKRKTTQIKVVTKKRDGKRGAVAQEEWKCATCGNFVGKA